MTQFAVGVFVLTMLAPAVSQAQWDSHWNESGPHPDSCIYNDVQFYAGDEVCVRPGVRQVCGLDGTLGPPESDLDCKAAQPGATSIVHAQGRSDIACSFGRKRFSVGSEICSASGSKVICGANGALGAPRHEEVCKAPLATSGE